MADTRMHLLVEEWVRQEWMPVRFGQQFSARPLKLSSGGIFNFDAVSQDGLVVALISTSRYITEGGKNGSGKLHKIEADILRLIMVKAERRLVILTEQDMFDKCTRDKNVGRLPSEVDFYLAEVPEELSIRLRQSRYTASSEVSPFSSTTDAVVGIKNE